jgi:hypothetical protein
MVGHLVSAMALRATEGQTLLRALNVGLCPDLGVRLLIDGTALERIYVS